MESEKPFGPALSLGAVNMVLKVVVLCAVAMTGQLIVHSFILISGLTLKATRSAQFMYDSDGSIFHIRHIFKRSTSLSGFGTLACILAMALFPAEMTTDFGVVTYNRCKPELLQTWGICAASIVGWDGWSSRLSLAMVVENLGWDKRELIRFPIRQGFRKTCDGTEYFGNRVKRNTSLPIVVHRCWARNMRIVGGSGSILKFGNITETRGEGVGFISMTTPNRSMSYRGIGGIFDNYKFLSSFLTVQHPDNEDGSCSASVLEYPNSQHLNEIRRHAVNNSRFEVKSRGPILGYDVGCRWASLNAEKFHEAIYTYRFAQLSRSAMRNAIPRVNLTISQDDNRIAKQTYSAKNETRNSTRPSAVKAPCPLDAGDVVKAVIAMKITENLSCKGETYRYMKCGGFDVTMAYPLMTVMVMVFGMWCTLLFLMHNKDDGLRPPVTANQWMSFAIQSCAAQKKYVTLDSEEYKKEYKQYGREDVMGEFMVKKAYVGYTFVLRRLIFIKPKKDSDSEDGVATMRNVLSFSELESRVGDNCIRTLENIV